MQTFSEQLYLVVDTSIQGVGLALVLRSNLQHKVLWSGLADGQFASAGKISHLLEEGLRAAGCTLDDCKVIAVSVGPGSFTGIKIGLAWCYGLFAPRQQQLRWLPLSALEAAAMLAQQRGAQEAGSCLFLASTRTHGYIAYGHGGPLLVRSCLYAVGQGDSPWGALPEFLSSTSLTLCGEWPLLVEEFQRHKLPWDEISIRQLMEWSLQGMITQVLSAEYEQLSSKPPRPRYLRQSTAEENLKGSKRHEFTTS